MRSVEEIVFELLAAKLATGIRASEVSKQDILDLQALVGLVRMTLVTADAEVSAALQRPGHIITAVGEPRPKPFSLPRESPPASTRRYL